MPVTALDHVLIRATDLERSRRFYCDVLGFEEMARPTFPFPGHWLGVGGRIQVHLALHGVADSALYYLGTKPTSATDNSGVIDHVAFAATQPERFAERFDAVGLPVRKRHFPEFKLFQMFVADPDGVVVELNFHGIDEAPAWAEDGENYGDMPRMPKAST